MEQEERRIEITPMLLRYLLKFAIRISIFVWLVFFYLKDKELMYEMAMQPVFNGINRMHVLWFVYMVMMVRHLFPRKHFSMAMRKFIDVEYDEQEGYKEIDLLRFVQEMNQKVWLVLLIWLVFNAFFGCLYLFHIIGNAELVMLTGFYFICDYICILIFCPFQTYIMKNRCCVNCRIYDWGHFMMFTPMLFIRSFFSWSLFFASLVVLIHWELVYARHPERFWYGSNKRLQCANCRDKTCRIKKNVRHYAKKLV